MEENSRVISYPDAGMEVRICDKCIELKIASRRGSSARAREGTASG
ncbi:MAG: hypothetical protein V3U49_00510 [Nitrososphaerales archaeon]